MILGRLAKDGAPEAAMWTHPGQTSQQDIIAILYCPGNHRIDLSGNTHGIAPDGQVIGIVTCPVKGCWRDSKVRLHDWAQAGTTFYAVATERFVGAASPHNGFWKAEVVYCHALDDANARFLVMQASRGEYVRIVAIGPVIGYNVDNATGSKLSV